MGIVLYVTGVALIALAVLLLTGMSTARSVRAKFALLDRDRQLPKLVRIMLISSTLALVCALAVLGLTLTLDSAPDATPAASVATAPLQPEPKAAAANPGPTEPSPPVAVERATIDAAPARTAAEPHPAPDPKPVEMAPTGDWRLATIVSSGDVTMRAWPNGTSMSLLAPGDRVLTQDQAKDAGGHSWQKVRLPDGRTGWVVRRFVHTQ